MTEFTKSTMVTLKPFLKAHSQSVSRNNQEHIMCFYIMYVTCYLCSVLCSRVSALKMSIRIIITQQ